MVAAAAIREPAHRNRGWRPLNLGESPGPGEALTRPSRHLQAVHAGWWGSGSGGKLAGSSAWAGSAPAGSELTAHVGGCHVCEGHHGACRGAQGWRLGPAVHAGDCSPGVWRE